MTSENLTTADGFTLENATKEDHEYDYTSDLDVSLDRWSKGGHDRLYVNGLNWDCYVDLSDGSVHVDGGSKLTPVGTELDGDELTITVVYGREIDPDKTVEITATVEGDEFETDENDENHEQEIACDGGDDTTEHFSDDEIVAAIEQHDDRDHPEATTVDEVRTSLAEIQRSFEHFWSEHLDSIDEAAESIVYEDDEVLVLADHTGHGWNEEKEAAKLSNPVLGDILKSVHHKAAERRCDYSWQASDPFVISKRANWQLGELHVERRVAQLATAADASEAAAMDYWSVEIKGRSQSQWARMVGKSQQTVSENIRKVKDGLGAELS